jgi:hypothetical protein
VGVCATGLTTQLVEEHIREAESRLDSAAGSSSLCSISRSGESIAGVKYPEGAWAALREVRRLIPQVSSTRAAIEQVRLRWLADREQRENNGASASWQAYLMGGIDAMDRLLEHPG